MASSCTSARLSCGRRSKYLHFHCVVQDGVFASTPTGDVVFHPATAIDEPAIAAVQAKVRRRLLESFVRRGLLESDAAHAMQAWQHGGGFSVDASVRIEAADRPGLERLLRYCARPPFALERLQQRDAEHLLYAASKPSPGDCGPQLLTPLQLIDRLAALVPPASPSSPLLRRAGAQLTPALRGDRHGFANGDARTHRATPQPGATGR